MLRCLWLPVLALAVAACGTDDDRRPRSVEYITAAILAPNCGNAQCHSQFRQESGYVLDTVEHARPYLVGLVAPIELNDRNEPVGDPSQTIMMSVLTREIDPMPYDRPLPDGDLDLIARWIEFGAPGAQCDPSVSNGRVCVGRRVVECKANFDYGGVVETCANTCALGACR